MCTYRWLHFLYICVMYVLEERKRKSRLYMSEHVGKLGGKDGFCFVVVIFMASEEVWRLGGRMKIRTEEGVEVLQELW